MLRDHGINQIWLMLLREMSHPLPHITPFPNQEAHEPQGEGHHHRHREEGKHIEPASLFPGIGKHQDSRSHIGIQHGHDRFPQGRTLRIAVSLQQHGSVRGVAFKFGGKSCRGEGMEHEFIRFFVHLFICFLRPKNRKTTSSN